MTDIKRLRGLKALLLDVVEHGSSAVERMHLQTAGRPFEIVKYLLPSEQPVVEIHALHDSFVSGVYGNVRMVNRLVGKALDVALDALDESSAETEHAPSDDDA